jgi:hypothetical protein
MVAEKRLLELGAISVTEAATFWSRGIKMEDDQQTLHRGVVQMVER